jgi:hypothetical protein
MDRIKSSIQKEIRAKAKLFVPGARVVMYHGETGQVVAMKGGKVLFLGDTAKAPRIVHATSCKLLVHFLRETATVKARCGAEWTAKFNGTNSDWSKVTCPKCLETR